MIAYLYQPTLTTTPGETVGNMLSVYESYEHTISATFGFETCSIERSTTIDAAMRYTDLLLAPLIVYGEDASVAWEGYLNTVTISAGERARSVSLDALQNRVRVRYQTVLGTPGVTAATSDAASIARYGTRDGVVSVGVTTAAVAATTAAAVLAERATPQAQPTSSARTTRGSVPVDTVRLRLEFVGWYNTLDWVVLERTDTSTEQTSNQIATLIGGSAPGIGAINPLISTSTARITSTGVSDTRQIAADTTYRSAIEQRLSKGNSSNQRLAWGVYEDRVLRVETWAGATPSTIAYQLRLRSSVIATPEGLIVPGYAVRPNAMIEETDFADPTPGIGADTASRFFVERVTYRRDAGGDTVTFEPASYSGLDARLARIG
jgi:hypothetical protein